MTDTASRLVPVLAPDEHARIARELRQSTRQGVQLEQLSRRHPGLTVGDSYAIQRRWAALRLSEGRSVIGHKIGLTSRAMQSAAQISEPDYGVLLDDMLLASGCAIGAAGYFVPRLEAEFAYRLCRPIQGPGVTLLDVLDATDYVQPALELIDARIEQFDRATRAPRTVLDTIADNAASAAVILGGRPTRPHDVDWGWAGAMLYRTGVIEETGLGAGVLGHPGNGVAWLAGQLAAHGEALAAGELVLAGSFTRPVSFAAGDTFHADYGPLGSIAGRFT